MSSCISAVGLPTLRLAPAARSLRSGNSKATVVVARAAARVPAAAAAPAPKKERVAAASAAAALPAFLTAPAAFAAQEAGTAPPYHTIRFK
jgi:hypothetical protein